METKYGNFEEKQIKSYKNELHKNVLSLLYMKEENCKTLDTYFSSLIWKLSGFNEIFNHQTVIIDIMSYLEEAKKEASLQEYSHDKYRKLILDAFNLIDKIKESEDPVICSNCTKQD